MVPEHQHGGLREHVRAGRSASTLNDIWSAQSTLSRTMGGHLMKAGAQLRLYRMIRTNVGNQNGSYSFNSGFTQRNALTGDGSRQRVRLLPARLSVGRQRRHQRRERSALSATTTLFVQDDWKLNATDHAQPRAALGLPVAVTEVNNAMTVGYDSSTPNPFQLPRRHDQPGDRAAATARYAAD